MVEGIHIEIPRSVRRKQRDNNTNTNTMARRTRSSSWDSADGFSIDEVDENYARKENSTLETESSHTKISEDYTIPQSNRDIPQSGRGLDGHTGANWDWHDALESNDMEKLQKMLKKYDTKYYTKKHKKVAKKEVKKEKKIAKKEVKKEKKMAKKAAKAEKKAAKKAKKAAKKGGGSPTPQYSPKRDLSPMRGDIDSTIHSNLDSTLHSVDIGTDDGTSDNDELNPDGTLKKKKKKLRLKNIKNVKKIGKIKKVGKVGKGGKKVLKSMRGKKKEVVFPLMQQDEYGHTPLHIACLGNYPDPLLVDLLVRDPQAATVPDNEGQLVLHAAITANRYNHILGHIIKAHPSAIRTKDVQNRTPVQYAVEMAIKRQQNEFPDDNKFRWWTDPINDKEQSWQFTQQKLWGQVDYLLETLSNRKKSILPSEHEILIDAIEAGIPPDILNHFVTVTAKYLQVDDELAGTSIAFCVKRQYPLSTLKNLIDHCREKTILIIDAKHKALNSHYQEGCFAHSSDTVPFGKEVLHIAKKALKKASEGKHKRFDPSGMSSQCLEWWEKLQFLLFHCAYGNNYKPPEKLSKSGEHMLHAALCIPSTPPSLIQLIMMAYPESRTMLCPVFKALPIHLSSIKWKYDLLQNKKDTSTDSMMKQLVAADSKLLYARSERRMPLHLAIVAGQSWSFLKLLVRGDRSTLTIRDPITKLFPFQLAAAQVSVSKNSTMIVRMQHTPAQWRELDDDEKRDRLTKAKEAQELLQLGTIFNLLRCKPGIITGKPKSFQPVRATDIEGVGKVAAHYLAWCYTLGPRGWQIRRKNVSVLTHATETGKIPKPLEKWWYRLKFWIWHWSNGQIPKRDEFLLHAALYNPDTPTPVIELLLRLYPASVAVPLPDSENYPLHIAAGTSAYVSQPFEVPCQEDTLSLVLDACPKVCRLMSAGRLPLHLAILRGKMWEEFGPLVEEYPESLFFEESQSGLTPFQLMATGKTETRERSLRFSTLVQKQTRSIDWDEISAQKRGKILWMLQKKYENDLLSSIYALLRRGPEILDAFLLLQDEPAPDVTASNNDDVNSSFNGHTSRLTQYLKTEEYSPTELMKSCKSVTTGDAVLFQSPVTGHQMHWTDDEDDSDDDSDLLEGGTHRRSTTTGEEKEEEHINNGLNAYTVHGNLSKSNVYETYVKPSYTDDDNGSMETDDDSSLSSSDSSSSLSSSELGDDDSSTSSWSTEEE